METLRGNSSPKWSSLGFSQFSSSFDVRNLPLVKAGKTVRVPMFYDKSLDTSGKEAFRNGRRCHRSEYPSLLVGIDISGDPRQGKFTSSGWV